jgi:hypothetical protein
MRVCNVRCSWSVPSRTKNEQTHLALRVNSLMAVTPHLQRCKSAIEVFS